MSAEEYATVKAIFGDSMSDERIAELYKVIFLFSVIFKNKSAF